MSFSVEVTPDLVALEAGATTPISVVVVNKGAEADRFEMEIEGIDPEWKAVPVGIFGVEAGETHGEKVFFKPPRASESLAGNYPFVVRVRSLISGESRTVQGVAQVKSFHHLSMEIDPKKGFISPTRKQNIFDVTLVNLGNTEHTLQLLANDPEDACAYDFDQEQVTIGPGQQRDVELVVDPTTKPILSGGRLIGFSVSARSVSTPSVVASAQAQLEQRPLITPTTIAVLVLLAILFGAWFMMMPKPPAMTLAVTPQRVTLGSTVNVTWDAENAKRVIVRAGDIEIYNGTELKGQLPYQATKGGTVTFTAQAINGERKKEDVQEVSVDTPPPVPAPRILTLSATPSRVRLGEPFVMKYTLSPNVTEAVLQPTGERIDPVLNEQEIRPERTGNIQYTLVVKNATGDVSRKSFTVSIYDQSDARILEFRPSTKNVPAADPRVTITWQVVGAERVEIKPGGNDAVVVGSSGSQDFVLAAKTTFTLTAMDSKGRPVSRQTTVIVDVPPPTPPVTTGTTGGDTAGTATTGDTSGTATDGGTATSGSTTGTTTGLTTAGGR